MADYDAVVVGSGINSLACAAFLALAGWRVAVLEREAELGGAVRTAELTEPGFHHDVFSAWHPLWVGGPAHAELGPALAKRGLEYLNTEHPTGTLFPDGESAFLTTGTDSNAAELERHAAGDGEAWRKTIASVGAQAELVFGVLGTELWSPAGLGLGAKAYRRLGRRGLAEFGAEVVQSSRDWLATTFRSERAHGLLAPWVLHTGLGPDTAASGFMTRVIAFAIEAGGMPVPRGGGARLVDALVRLIQDHGGVCETGADVERVLVEGRRATGVRLEGGAPPEPNAPSSATSPRRSCMDACWNLPTFRRMLPKRGSGSASAAPRCRSTSPCPSRRAGTATIASAGQRSFI